MKQSFPIQPYTKFALACAYFPQSDSDTAIHRLWRWIKQNTSLCNALAETGYRSSQHHYSAKQTALIFEYLGEP